jgi:hypothetical protein
VANVGFENIKNKRCPGRNQDGKKKTDKEYISGAN